MELIIVQNYYHYLLPPFPGGLGILDLLNSIEIIKKHNTDLIVIKENIPSLKMYRDQCL